MLIRIYANQCNRSRYLVRWKPSQWSDRLVSRTLPNHVGRSRQTAYLGQGIFTACSTLWISRKHTDVGMALYVCLFVVVVILSKYPHTLKWRAADKLLSQCGRRWRDSCKLWEVLLGFYFVNWNSLITVSIVLAFWHEISHFHIIR